MTRWSVSNAEILDLRADGLICSGNQSLNLSGGVGGAFLLRYGTEMQDFLHRHLRANGLKFIEPGTAVVAPPCGSPFLAVAHAVAIDAFYETNAERICLAYVNAIHLLGKSRCRSIVATCLGCGYGRCSIPEFAEAISHLVTRSFPGVDTITLASTNSDLTDAIVAVIPAC